MAKRKQNAASAAPKRRGRPATRLPRYRPNRILALRLKEGLSQTDLAALVGGDMTTNKVSQIEGSVRALKAEEMYRFADALGVHPIEIFEELPYSAPIRALADRVSELSEAEQERIFRIIDLVAPPKDPGAS